MSTTPIVCIYCKKLKPPSGEHIVQKSLGGDLVAPIDCGDRNRGFSPIDQALAECSLVGLTRVGQTPLDAFDMKLGGEHFCVDPASGLTLEVALRNGRVRAETYPQVHFLSDGSGAFRAVFITKDRADFERLAAHVGKKIEGGQLRSVHSKVGPPEAGGTPTLVMHRDADCFIRGQTQSEIDQIFDLLQAGWERAVARYRATLDAATSPAMRTIANPEVRVTLRIDFNQVYRAVAKIAFNYMATKLGADFALSAEFDDIRKYILGTDVRLPVVGPDEIAIDNRFVRAVPPETEPPIRCEDHGLTVFSYDGGTAAWVTLYGSSHFVVRLGDIAPTDSIPHVHIFSASRSGNAALDQEEILKRLVVPVPTT